MEELLHDMHVWMHAYMRSFHTEDIEVMKGIRLKEIHTGYVTTNARALARHLGCSVHDTALAQMIGLFHDVGRFRQYAVYRTFNDAQSEDHAELGLKVLSELDFLERLSRCALQFAGTIRKKLHQQRMHESSSLQNSSAMQISSIFTVCSCRF